MTTDDTTTTGPAFCPLCGGTPSGCICTRAELLDWAGRQTALPFAGLQVHAMDTAHAWLRRRAGRTIARPDDQGRLF